MKFSLFRPSALLLLTLTLPALAQDQTKQKTVEQVVQIVKTYCGACHNPPSPSLMPKKDWPYVVKRMAELAEQQAGREFISEEHIRDISAYYYGSSPAELPLLPHTAESKSTIQFELQKPGKQAVFPLIANIRQVNLSGNDSIEFLVCDAESNQVSLLEKKGKKWRETVLAEVSLPTHTEVVDYDQDGDQDIIVSSLGRFFPPVDYTVGKVVLLRQIKKGKFVKEILLEGVPRVLETRAHDVDGDGDLDLLVAIFGNNDIGEIAWLENQGEGKIQKHTLLNYPGALSIIPGDINNDGLVDLVTLISQEYEMIVALVNKGKGKYEPVAIFQGSEPMLGSTSIQPGDIDSDGDLDILFTNGDAHDLQTDPKPYHGVQWLENTGQLKFKLHNLGRFYGAVNAKAADMDNDGDMDIVVASWNNLWDNPKRQTLIWLENDGKQNFTRHNIISRPKSIVSFELADIDNDKRLDIVAGIFKIDLLKNKVEVEKDGREPKNTEDYDFKSKKDRLIILRNTLLKNKAD